MKIRQRWGFSIEELAEAAGVEADYLRRVEAGSRKAGEMLAHRLANVIEDRAAEQSGTEAAEEIGADVVDALRGRLVYNAATDEYE